MARRAPNLASTFDRPDDRSRLMSNPARPCASERTDVTLAKSQALPSRQRPGIASATRLPVAAGGGRVADTSPRSIRGSLATRHPTFYFFYGCHLIPGCMVSLSFF
jgi:hypothetical protein